MCSSTEQDDLPLSSLSAIASSTQALASSNLPLLYNFPDAGRDCPYTNAFEFAMLPCPRAAPWAEDSLPDISLSMLEVYSRLCISLSILSRSKRSTPAATDGGRDGTFPAPGVPSLPFLEKLIKLVPALPFPSSLLSFPVMCCERSTTLIFREKCEMCMVRSV